MDTPGPGETGCGGGVTEDEVEGREEGRDFPGLSRLHLRGDLTGGFVDHQWQGSRIEAEDQST